VTAVTRKSRRQTLEAEIARLGDLGLAELRVRWKLLYGRPAPKFFRRKLLVRAVAYQMQVAAYGGLSEATKRRLREIADAARDGTFDAAMTEPRIKPGTRLIRTCEERTCQFFVNCNVDGYACLMALVGCTVIELGPRDLVHVDTHRTTPTPHRRVDNPVPVVLRETGCPAG
jgi:hypothetical protein